MNQTKAYLNASIFFALLSLGLFAGLGYAATSTLAPVLAILSGMTTMGALTSFQRFLELGSGSQTLEISFNEAFLRTTIEEAFRHWAKAGRPHTKQAPWGLVSSQLIGMDNALALAKLRMDLETELRRVAHQSEVSLPEHSVGIRAIAQQLVTAKLLPAQFLEPLSEIAEVCNRGVHGADVPNELAASVVRIGNQLLESLRFLPEHSNFS